MAKVFDRWTVLPHRPIQKHTENFWSVEGTMPDGKTRRVMSVARRSDGRLVIHNGIALEEPLMAEIEALGEPGFLLVPNGFHRQDARIFKRRYPKMTVLCPAGSKRRVTQVIAVDGSYEDAPKDSAVRIAHLEGMKAFEGVLEVRSNDGSTVVLNDAVCNMPKLSGLGGFFLAPSGIASVPRFARWLLIKDKGAFKAHLLRLAQLDGLKRIVVSHGDVIQDSPRTVLEGIGAAV